MCFHYDQTVIVDKMRASLLSHQDVLKDGTWPEDDVWSSQPLIVRESILFGYFIFIEEILHIRVLFRAQSFEVILINYKKGFLGSGA